MTHDNHSDNDPEFNSEPADTPSAPIPLPRPPQIGDMVNPFVLYRQKKTPYITFGTLAILVLIYLATAATGDLFYFYGASNGAAILYNGEWWRMFTAMFLHANLTHILFNGYALFVLGQDMERLYGPARYLLIYTLAGLYGSWLSFAVRGADQLSVGASGAIFGIMGMSLGFFLFYRNKLGQFGRDRFNSNLQVVGINLVIGFAIVRIDNAAHIGGLIAGFVLGYLLTPRHHVVDNTYPTPQTEDRGRLEKTWWIIAAATALFILLTSVAIRYWSFVS